MELNQALLMVQLAIGHNNMKKWTIELLLLILTYSIITLLWKQEKTWQFYILSTYVAISLSDDISKLFFLKDKK